MSEASSRPLDAGRQGQILVIALIVTSYIITFNGELADPTPFRIGMLIGLGVVYTAVTLFFGAYCERSDSPTARAIFFGVEILIGTSILYLSEGRAWLLMLPLAGDSVVWLSRRWMLVTCAAILAGMGFATGLWIAGMVGPEGEPLFHLDSVSLWLNVGQNVLAYGAAIAFVILFTQIAVREREARAEVERLAAELQYANRQLREYATQAAELATLRERTRLAREIHDGLGHYLTAINMQIQAGRAVLEHDREAALGALDNAQTLAQEGLAEVRRAVATLRTSPLDTRPLPEAVGDLVNECRSAGIATEYAIHGEVLTLDPQTKLALYRAAQEGMTNMRKHAQTSRAEVTIEYPETASDEKAIRLTIRDYGVGSNSPSGGFGLIGVHERVRLLGGEVRIETEPGEGFALIVEVPSHAGRPSDE
jgi:signal transduction histidine kinase